ncbi:tRNA pseudouridine(13) synthase TruD [Colwellia sp. MEBiC06753]
MSKFKPYQSLPYLNGKPEITGDLRTFHQDFKVFEILPFAPTGEGEHLLIHLEKTGQNTVQVARSLAKYFKVKDSLVSYAGLKDRHAVTQQWFGVHLPGKQEYDLSDLAIDGVKVLQVSRHNKKLKTGALLGNRFELTLRKVSNVDALIEGFEKTAQTGVPNYFGEQRFGFNGNNLVRALAMFNGQKIKDKKKRGLYLSAARSYIFNQMIACRIKQQYFATALCGDVFMLAETNSVFRENEPNTDISERLSARQIDITAPMWGAGELMTQLEANALETSVAQESPELCDGLANFGLKQERRRIRLNLVNGRAEKLDDSSVKLSFILSAGSYATAILRELIDYTDVSEQFRPEN